MKKFLSLFITLILTLSVSLLGCGDGDQNGGETPKGPHVHELEKIEAVEATYDAGGNIEYYKCKGKGCGKLFLDSKAKTIIEINDTLTPIKLRPLTYLSEDINYEFETLPNCLYYANFNEIDLTSRCEAGTTNARLNNTYAKAFPGLDYIFLKADGLGDFVVEFEIKKSGVWHFAFEIFAIEDDVYERRVTNFKIDNSKELMLDYTHSDECAGKHQYASGFTAELEAGKHFLTLSLPNIFDDNTVKSLFIHKFYYCKVE